MNKEEIQETEDEIKEIKELISEAEEEIKDYERGNDNKEDEYKEYLDSTNDIIYIGDCSFNPSEVLARCDNIAFRCGFNDWADQFITELNTELEDLKEQLEDAETELKELKVV